ncbi:hypothetical protein [Microbacterium sp.]|uniref:hypothetical protein n=1 Tax=Microbacterium sp. TaxID=51671 RepID=UPI00334080A3
MTDSASPSTPIPRRTIVKGAAWSVPIVAAAVAVPAYAASQNCAGTATVSPNLYDRGVLTVTLPACARTVSYVVAGGSGGGGVGARRGSMVTGTLSVSGGETLTLVAGAPGMNREEGLPSRALGYGDGGLGTSYYSVDQGKDLFAGGGGGAGSALLLGSDYASGTPLIVAGGGGGSGWATAWGNDDYWFGGRAGYGGEGEPNQDIAEDAAMNAQPNPPGEMVVPLSEFGYHGMYATHTAAGAGGLVSLSGQGAGYPQPAGLPGGDGVGRRGGDGPATDLRADPTQENVRYGGGGGGGGGWFGGGAGATLWMAAQSGAAGGAGGGSGSNYYGGAAPGAPATAGTVSIPYPSNIEVSSVPEEPGVIYKGFPGRFPGIVTISWS